MPNKKKNDTNAQVSVRLNGKTHQLSAEQAGKVLDKIESDVSKIEKRLDQIEEDEIETLKKSALKTLGQAQVDAQPSKSREELLSEATDKIISEVTTLVTLDNENLPEGVDVEKFKKVFSAALRTSIENEEEPDFSDLLPPTASQVEETVNNYVESNALNIGDLKTQLRKIRKLFIPDPSKFIDANYNYRTLTRYGNCQFSSGMALGVFFGKQRLYNDSLDVPAIERIMRRLDSEISALDEGERNECVFNFVSEILAKSNGTEKPNTFFFLDANSFYMVSEESRKILRDLIFMYIHTVKHNVAYVKSCDNNTRELHPKVVEQLIEMGKATQKYPMGEYDSRGSVVRFINEEDYFNIVELIKALRGALPSGFYDTIRAAMMLDSRRAKIGISDAVIHSDILQASKYLREALIAISQNRGSFETFFTAMYRYYQALNSELNKIVEIASYMVGAYDSLGLNIAETLESSKDRILSQDPF